MINIGAVAVSYGVMKNEVKQIPKRVETNSKLYVEKALSRLTETLYQDFQEHSRRINENENKIIVMEKDISYLLKNLDGGRS